MKQQFDQAAADYDKEFTHSAIGEKLRKIVWKYLEGIILPNQKLKILEINCGTGEDAVFLAHQGHTILGIDVSEEMILQAKQKARSKGLENNISFTAMDIRNLDNELNESGFDLVLSDFGGLNCLNDIENRTLSNSLTRFLKPGGRFISVIMGKYCLWESAYYMIKGEFNEMFRRTRKQGLQVPVSGEKVQTWYYTPNEFQNFFKDNFRRAGLYPLGFFLPPSYLNLFFQKRTGMLRFLENMETLVNGLPLMAYLSDHYILDLETK